MGRGLKLQTIKILIALSSVLFCSMSMSRAVLLSSLSPGELQSKYSQVERIGIYLGTFDPLHLAHQEIIRYVLDRGYVDLVILAADDNVPHKPNANRWEYRNGFAKVAFRNDPRVIVADIEKGFDFPVVPKNIEKVRGLLPKASFAVIIGNDIATLPDFKKKPPKIIREYGGFVDFWLINNSRPDLSEGRVLPQKILGKKTHVFSTDLGISSSDIRKTLAQEEKSAPNKDTKKLRLSDYLSLDVIDFIYTQGLYGLAKDCRGFLN